MKKKTSKAKKLFIGLLKALFPAATLLFLLFLAGAKALDLLGEFGNEVPSSGFYEELEIEGTKPDGTTYTINNSAAEFNIDLEVPDELGEELFPSFAEAAKFAKEKGATVLPSTQALLNVARHEDQRILEILQVGTDQWQSPFGYQARRQALLDLLDAAVMEAASAQPASRIEFEQAAAYVAGALLVTQTDLPKLSPAIMGKARSFMETFLSIPTRSKPIGHYTTSSELTRSFLQDRFLAQGMALNPKAYPARDDALLADGGPALAWVLIQHPKLAVTFRAFNDFDSRISNPVHPNVLNVAGLMDKPDLLDIGTFPAFREAFQHHAATRRKTVFALISYAFSKETALIHRIYTAELRIPQKSGMGEIIGAIKDGSINLEPTPESGWYDYQWYALETMLIPEKGRESRKLRPNPRYKKHLEESFKSGLASARETSIKELPAFTEGLGGGMGGQPLIIRPEFCVEPTPTVFLRKARAYDFLLQELKELSTNFTSGGPAMLKLTEERDFLLGIYYQLCLDLGFPPEWTDEEAGTALSQEETREALLTLWEHPGMVMDARFSVPVWYDNQIEKSFHWGIAGVKLVPLSCDFHALPYVSGADPLYEANTWYLPVAVFGEFAREGNVVFNREQWQDLCDPLSQKEIRRLLDIPREPYFGNSPEWLSAGLKTVTACLVLLATVIFLVRKRLRKALLRVLSRGFRWGGIALLTLAVLCLVSSRLRTRLFCESLFLIGGNYLNVGVFRLNDAHFNQRTVVNCLLAKVDNPNPQTRMDALSAYTYIWMWGGSGGRERSSLLKNRNSEALREKFLWVINHDPNAATRELALWALEDFSVPADIPMLIEFSKAAGEFGAAMYQLQRYMDEPGVKEVFIEAAQSTNRGHYWMATGILTQTYQPWALGVLLNEWQAGNHSETKQRKLLMSIDEMVLKIPVPKEPKASAFSTGDRHSDPEPPEAWRVLCRRIVKLETLPVGIRIRAVRRLPAIEQAESVSKLVASSKLLHQFSQLPPDRQSAWAVVFREIHREGYEQTLTEIENNLRDEERHSTDVWDLERLMDQIEENTRLNREYQEGYEENPFLPSPADSVELAKLCACLAMSASVEWQPLALAKDIPLKHLSEIAWFLKKITP